MIDALPLGEIDRQHAPLDSPFRHIKDGIEHRSHTQGARSSTAFGGGDQIFDPLPFLVSQVAWIDFFVHLPIVPTYEDFSDRLFRSHGPHKPQIKYLVLGSGYCASFARAMRTLIERGALIPATHRVPDIYHLGLGTREHGGLYPGCGKRIMYVVRG